MYFVQIYRSYFEWTFWAFVLERLFVFQCVFWRYFISEASEIYEDFTRTEYTCILMKSNEIIKFTEYKLNSEKYLCNKIRECRRSRGRGGGVGSGPPPFLGKKIWKCACGLTCQSLFSSSKTKLYFIIKQPNTKLICQTINIHVYLSSSTYSSNAKLYIWCLYL